MSDGTIPRCIERAGIQIDVGRMRLPANLKHRYEGLLAAAVENREVIESGGIANVDEGRQVGHYWLRNPALTPEHGAKITSALDSIHDFWKKHFRDDDRFVNILWIGIGGSGLAPQLLYDALGTPGKRPTMFFFDNTDPSGLKRTLRKIKQAGGLKRTLAVVVSKSGGTPETKNGMIVARKAFESAGLKFEEHAVAITELDSKLGKLAGPVDPADPDTVDPEWLARFPIWDFVGGRSSLFSAVGLLPARLLGLSTDDLMDGAKAMDEVTRDGRLDHDPALLLATTWYHAVETQGLRSMVVLPYCDRLVTLSKYLQQLVMESLGKDGKGITVFGNKGSTDQHAYVQQLREGYRDFFATFIRVLVPDDEGEEGDDQRADHDWEEVESGVTCGDYLAAFQEGTAQALADAGRPSLCITLERLTERSFGALVALFERAVGYYGAMLGINAYHQPGVEAGKLAANAVIALQKRLVRFLSGQPGVEYTAAELVKKIEDEEKQRMTDGEPSPLPTNERLVRDILTRLALCRRGRVVFRDEQDPVLEQPIRRFAVTP